MLLNFVSFLSFLSFAWAIDKTLVPKTNGEDVVCEVIKKIADSNIFPDDKKMLRRIAFVESRFGEDKSTYRQDYHGGIWQIDKIGFDDAVITGSHPKLDKLWTKIETLLNKQKVDIKWEDLRKPLFSGVFARIRLYLINGIIPFDLIEQAKVWKKNYNSYHENAAGSDDEFINRVNAMNDKFGSDCNNCQGRMNLAIIMDGSGSIGSQDYERAKTAAVNLLDTFSTDLVDVGYVLFSSSVDVLFPLKSNLTRDQMKKEILESRYPDMGTRTDLAIDKGVTVLGTENDATGVPKVMAIFTDGNPDDHQRALLAAEQAKKFNIIIFAVAIGGGIDQNNLNEMASQQSYVISVTSYKDLVYYFDKINSKTCSVPQTPDIGTKVEKDQLRRNEKRYLKLELPIEGITLKIENINGKAKGYYSYTVENPSSANNDGEFTDEVFIAPLQSGYVRVKREDRNSSSVYVTVEGEENENVYSLDSSEGNHTSGAIELKTSMLLLIVTNFLLFIKFF